MTTTEPRTVWRCLKCGTTIAEGDVPYTGAECRATLRCKGAAMIRERLA